MFAKVQENRNSYVSKISINCLKGNLEILIHLILPPSSHTGPFPFSPLHHQKNMHTHLFTACWFFNHQHLNTLICPEGTIVVCLIPAQTTILPLLFLELQQMAQHLGLQWGTGAYLENRQKCWKNPLGFLHPPLAHFHSSFYSAGGGRRLVTRVVDFFPFLVPSRFCWRVDFTFLASFRIW